MNESGKAVFLDLQGTLGGDGSLTTFKHTWSSIEADYVAENILEAVKWVIDIEYV